MLCSVLFVSHRSKLTHLFVLRYSFLALGVYLTFVVHPLCHTLKIHQGGEALPSLYREIVWSNTRDHVIQYKRSCDPIQEIMWSNTRDHVTQYKRSCDPIQEIMWSNMGDHVTQYKRSCDPIWEIMWPNTRDHVIQYKRSCDPIQEINAKLDLTTTSKNRIYTVTQYG